MAHGESVGTGVLDKLRASSNLRLHKKISYEENHGQNGSVVPENPEEVQDDSKAAMLAHDDADSKTHQ